MRLADPFQRVRLSVHKRMMHRILIEFVIDIPNADVAKDVETRLVREHHANLCQTLTSVTGYEPLQRPGRPGILVAHEFVTWSDSAQDWIGESDDDDEEDEDEDEDDDA